MNRQILHVLPHHTSLPSKSCRFSQGVNELQARARQSSSHVCKQRAEAELNESRRAEARGAVIDRKAVRSTAHAQRCISRHNDMLSGITQSTRYSG